MGADNNSLTPLKNILKNMFGDESLPFNVDDARIWTIWGEAVGPAISKNARPSWIKDKKLRVIVRDPIWLQELQFVEQEIRKKLNNKLGREAIRKIDFRVGAI